MVNSVDWSRSAKHSKACSRPVVAFLQLHDEECDSLLCKYLSVQVTFYDLHSYEILTNIPQYPNGQYYVVNQQTSLEATTVICKIKQNFSEGF